MEKHKKIRDRNLFLEPVLGRTLNLKKVPEPVLWNPKFLKRVPEPVPWNPKF
jgi:hypothetical protein